MADKKRLLDVWILEINKVYREVPFAVVTDWLQQGRLLPEDKVRLAGGKTWHPLTSVPALAPFLPRAEPLTIEDKAEALEPVDLGFVPTRRLEDEDEDVDMIPLIDISLVLLIFFMMTATVSSGLLSTINTPGAKYQLATPAAESLWIGVDGKSGGGQVERGPDGKSLPWYSFGKDNMEISKPTINPAEVLDALAKALATEGGEVNIRLRADRGLPIETIKGITLDLHSLEDRLNRQRGQGSGKLRFTITGEVSEPRE
ncbi:MAG TPA: biopolymer transporter ExbD [Gemmataceae bacterium]|jgi:biopolymer transport protein ExbD|nr:biopolymer transporter ExbD [Gemmataceae bacterium]